MYPIGAIPEDMLGRFILGLTVGTGRTRSEIGFKEPMCMIYDTIKS